MFYNLFTLILTPQSPTRFNVELIREDVSIAMYQYFWEINIERGRVGAGTNRRRVMKFHYLSRSFWLGCTFISLQSGIHAF